MRIVVERQPNISAHLSTASERNARANKPSTTLYVRLQTRQENRAVSVLGQPRNWRALPHFFDGIQTWSVGADRVDGERQPRAIGSHLAATQSIS
jgi:hypothetical protein